RKPARTCTICGDVFTPLRSNQQLCGKEACRKQRQRQYAAAHAAKHSGSKKGLEPRICEQCGTEFVPAHHTSKLCSDRCREQRAKDRQNGIKKVFRRAELRRDADEVQQEMAKDALAEKYAPSHLRLQPGSNPQAA